MNQVAPISVCLITKNEAGQIENCLKSIRPYVAEICVVDTGSIDSTPEICKKYADKLETYTECNDSQGRIESFSEARNRSFGLASQPWVMWIDGDDEVQGAENLYNVIQNLDHLSRPILILFQYEYSHDDKGNVTCLHWRERLVQPKEQFEWVNPVHEVLNPKIPNTIHIRSEAVRIIHRRDLSGKIIEPGRNLRILKKHYANVGESDVRSLYYLGLEYGNNGDIESALKFHKRYIKLSGWDDERFQACLKIVEHYQTSGRYEEAIEWALKSLTIREGWAESYFALARNYYFLAQRNDANSRRNWERCIYFSKLGLDFPPTETILFVNPTERDFEIHKYLNVAYNNVGRVEDALDSVNTALQIKGDPGLEHNKRLYELHLARVRINTELDVLNRYENDGGISVKAKHIIDSILDGKFLVSQELEQTKSDKLDIVFYVGSSIESWNPKTIKKNGIGGSETAVWEMGRRFAKMGHRVRVFGDCPGRLEGVFEDVEFLYYDKCRDLTCDVFITSRQPHIVDDGFNIKSKIKLCWVHDIHCGSGLNHERALKIDKFLCLSKWHKDFFLAQYPYIHPDQVIVTRNGIDLSRFESNDSIIRNPHKGVYSSSPDRGLEIAIKSMPKIRERVPDAELHIYYGFKNWEISAKLANSKDQMELIQYLKILIEEHEEHGVVFHDRLDQDTLAKEFMSAGVWMYPTWFSETSCITAMEAQAAGLHIVTSPIAALNETVGDRGTMIEGDWLSPEYMEKFVNAVEFHMNRSGDDERKSLQQYARGHFGWDSLVNDWVKMFESIVEEVMENIVPAFKSV